MMEKPLVSFCQMCYNQREYIGAALDAAFSQTYEPLEIVICDDHSTDGSWELITEKVAAYRGPHKVVCHRNDANLGCSRNCQKLFELSHGVLLFKCDGDDVSKANRVEAVVNAWIADGRRAAIIGHGSAHFDMSGKVFNIDTSSHLWNPFGAASVYTRTVVDAEFATGDLAGCMDDVLYHFRSLMIGDYLHMPEDLLYYRVGGGVFSREFMAEKKRKNVDSGLGLVSAA